MEKYAPTGQEYVRRHAKQNKRADAEKRRADMENTCLRRQSSIERRGSYEELKEFGRNDPEAVW